MPSVPGAPNFAGQALHASAFQGGAPYVWKRVIVVGAGNTAADMCIVLHASGAAHITLLQRAPTCVIPPDLAVTYWEATHPIGSDTETCDFLLAARPWGLVQAIAREANKEGKPGIPSMSERDSQILEGLEKKGYRVSAGPDGLGAAGVIMETFAGAKLHGISTVCDPLTQ